MKKNTILVFEKYAQAHFKIVHLSVPFTLDIVFYRSFAVQTEPVVSIKSFSKDLLIQNWSNTFASQHWRKSVHLIVLNFYLVSIDFKFLVVRQ